MGPGAQSQTDYPRHDEGPGSHPGPRRKPDDLQSLVLAMRTRLRGSITCGHRTHEVETEHTPHGVRLSSLTGHGPRTAQTEWGMQV